MKTSKTHKHIWISGRVISVDYNNGRWETGVSWGSTPEIAAREYTLSNTYQRDMEPKTIEELHENEK